MKILITGICGFVGNTLAVALRELVPGVEIAGFDNFIRAGSELNRRRLQDLGITVSHADLRVQSDIDALPAADWVIDAAANASVLAGVDGRTSSRQIVEHNLVGTVNLLEYCKAHCAGFVLLSTSRVYSIPPLANLPMRVESDAFALEKRSTMPDGVSSEGLDESFSTAAPVSLYGTTKLCSEKLALEYGEAFGLSVWINRCGVLAGAGQFGRVDQGIFTYWLNAWLRRRPLKYIGFGGSGYQVRDVLHPRDLGRLVAAQIQAPEKQAPRIVHAAGGRERAISLKQLSVWSEGRFGPHAVAAEKGERPFDIPWMVMDSARAAEHWNWRPEIGLEAILEEIAVHAEAHPDWLEIST